MYDHDYYAKMDKAMVRVLKAVARSVGYGFTGLYHYLKKQPTRLYEYIRYPYRNNTRNHITAFYINGNP